MPGDGKICSFDCIYCECGFNKDHRPQMHRPTREQVAESLEAKLREMAADGEQPDVLTFAGNGEPTLHPHFAEIIDDTLRLRDLFAPKAKVSVLSNATAIYINKVREALMRVDNNILKLDTVDEDYIRQLDRPLGNYSVSSVIDYLKSFRGQVIIQTMFLAGTSNGRDMDNTAEQFISPWLNALKEINPRSVMIYTIDRDTPDHGLRKAAPEVLDAIKARVIGEGIECSASY